MCSSDLGATGIIAAELVRKAPPDGHMIFMPATGMLSLNPILFAKNPYETRDFAPVTLAVSTPHLLVVPASSPANSVAELVALARSRPSGLSYASQGTATAGHLLGELFRSRTQARFEHVPYKGSGPGLIDTVAGRVDFFFDAIVSAGPFVRDGRLKLLAVASAQRAPQFASVPTMAEAGFPGVELDAAFGFAVVAGTPPAIVRRLNEEIVKALREPTLNRNLVEQGLRVVANTPEEYAAFIQAQRDMLTRVIKDANIRLD